MADNQVPLTPGIRAPQNYAVASLNIIAATGVMDLKLIAAELSYQEDLFNNTASGYLLVTDSMNYIQALNLNGNEYLQMVFSTSGDTFTEINKIFRIYKMDKRKLEGNMYTISYCLYFCSDEMIINEQYKVCKSYPNQPIFLNVADLLLNELKVPVSKIANIEPTYGNYDFVIPTIKPFDAINMMSVYARPNVGTPGADMIFFEDKIGFNFRSLQSMMQGDIYHDYAYNPKNTDPKNLNSALYNVLTYEIMNSYDVLNGVNSGAFANQLLSVDILTRTKKVTNFDYGSYMYEGFTLNDYPLINQFQDRKGHQLNQTSQAVYKLIYSNFQQTKSTYVKDVDTGSVAHNINAETYIPYRTAQLALANYTRLKISVPGDSNMTVGRVIGFSLGNINPNSEDPDKFYAGNYLVTAVRHLIDFIRLDYKTIMEISKDSTPNQYASPDSSSTLWQQLAKGNLNG